MTWVGLSNVPGWESVNDYINAIAWTHGGSVNISITTQGLKTTRLSVVVMWSRAGMTPAGPGTLTTSVKAFFPTSGHATMQGLLLALLHQLDYEVGSSYLQNNMPITE